jgi:hypothetical protein
MQPSHFPVPDATTCVFIDAGAKGSGIDRHFRARPGNG